MISGKVDAQGVPLGFTSTTQLDASTAIPLADPEVATDGAGNWVTAWSSDAGAGGDAEIFVATSTDNGVTWSAPIQITNNGIDDSAPSLATNGTVWVAAWSSGGTVNVATSNDAGANWTPPAPQGAGNSTAVDVNNTGVWVVAAEDAGDIVTVNSAAASAPIADGSADNPAIATDGLANWVTAFESGTNIGVANSSDNGASWSAVTIRDSGGLDAGPFVGFDPQVNTWIVIWNTDTGISMIASVDGGTTWSAASEILAGTTQTDRVSAATDANGNWTLVFANADSDIAFSTSSNNGADWGAAQLVADTATTDGNPNIATDGSGEWIAVWDSVGGSQILLFLATAITTTTLGLDGGGSSGPCFIASAAYGTPMAQDIEVLRQMRDTYLMDNALGLFFVDTYYAISPAIADQVAQYPWAASLVRALLIPVLFVVELFMRAPVPFLLMSIFAAAMIVRRRMTTRHAA